MKKSCILFACSIFSEDKEYVIRSFLDKFKSEFSDADIFIGINYGSITQLEDIIESYNLNCTVRRLEEGALYSKSDASAYQVAMKLLVESNKKYDYYWFVHTKGGVNPHSEAVREWYHEHYYSKRAEIEDFLGNHDKIGSYGLLGLCYNNSSQEYKNTITTDINIPIFENVLIPQLPYVRANFFYIHTLYTITKGPMQVFLDLVGDAWFETKLDTYYFEGVFPAIVSRAGYYPYVKNKTDMNGNDLYRHSIEPWIKLNDFNHFSSYLNLYGWESQFDQLSPNTKLC